MTDILILNQREIDKAHETPLQDAIDKMGTSGDGLELEVGRDSRGHAGATFEATKTKGAWSAGAAVQWVKDAGFAAWGRVKWSPK